MKEPKPIKELELDPKSFGICSYKSSRSIIVQQEDGLHLVTLKLAGDEHLKDMKRQIYKKTETEEIK